MNEIDVIVTCFNEEKYIGGAIESVLAQTRADLIGRIFVVDDGSTDGSGDVIAEWAKRDTRIVVLTQPNAGLAAARNAALAHVGAKWVCFLDGDDLWPAHKLERQWQAAHAEPEIALFYTDSVRFGSESRYIKARDLPDDPREALVDYFLNDAPILSSSMIKASVFEEIGVFDPELRMAQDTEMWTRIVGNYRVRRIPEPLLYRRMHAASLGANFDVKARYLNLATSKIVARFPKLRPYQRRKEAMVLLDGAKRCLRSGQRRGAFARIREALRKDAGNRHAYTVLLVACLPNPGWAIRRLSDLRMRLRGGAKNAQVEMPQGGRE